MRTVAKLWAEIATVVAKSRQRWSSRIGARRFPATCGRRQRCRVRDLDQERGSRPALIQVRTSWARTSETLRRSGQRREQDLGGWPVVGDERLDLVALAVRPDDAPAGEP